LPDVSTPVDMVELRDVHMQFEEKKVLDGVSLKVEPQERLVIMGQSGSGKSTILRLILGTLRPDSGSIFFKRFEITRLRRRKLQQVRQHIGMVIDELIISLSEKSKVTSITATHEMDSAFRIATRMAMLYQGKIIEEAEPEEFKQSKNPVVAQFVSGSTEGPILEGSLDAITKK